MKNFEIKHNSFYEFLYDSCKEDPNQVILFVGKEKIKNKDFLAKVDALASFLLSRGIKKGDMIAIFSPNCEEFIISLFAVSKISAIFVPINSFLKFKELQYILDDCKAKFLITHSSLRKEVKHIDFDTQNLLYIEEDNNKNSFLNIIKDFNNVDKDPIKSRIDDIAMVIYTSGTTDKPKGALLSYENLFSNMISAKERFKIDEKDRFIVYLPMFHSFTLMATILLPIYTKSPLIIIKSMKPFSNIIKEVLLKRVSIFVGVPDVFNALVRAKLPWYFMWFNKIRVFVSGAAPLSEDTLLKYEKRFPKIPLLEGYGLSECSPAVSVNTLKKQKPLSVGIPLSCCTVKIIDEEGMELNCGEVGEIIVKGKNVMKGYLGSKDLSEEVMINDWFKTGDLGKIDEDGFLYIVDRKKDLILLKGLNVYPREIEEELYKLQYVKDVAVVGIKAEGIELPTAFIELEEGFDNIDASMIKKELKKHLADYKIPKFYHFLKELPKNATGKVLKKDLRKGIY